MSIVEERKKALENKFVHDQELKFKAEGRRNKLIGVWAADLMGKADREAYGLEVIDADLKQAGDQDVFAKIRNDFDAAGVLKTDEEIRAKMEELLAVAVEQISGN
ncbi:DUF1476 domain-containing protein [Rhizobium leguminosarum]|uniref:DUF1476 domain-containing protein n=1 Tax=Rhizobium leguminosarum TaxID=384 RepID=UPI002E0D9A7E|nr:DUF1476 domain-containing protein [Rhizobium leguminosarum]